MKTFVILLLLLLAGAIGYAYWKDPTGCAKVGSDVADVFHSVTSGSLPPAPATNASPGQPAATASAPAPSAAPSPAPALLSPPPIAPPPVASAPVPAAHPSPDATKPWTPPDPIPSQPNWTWTTDDGKTYQNVVITEIKSDSVTITHSMGVAHLDPATLPPDIQKQVNYDPTARDTAKTDEEAQEWTTDYQAALAKAKSQNKLVLLDFTGSDWCGYCQLLEREVLTQPGFKTFAGQNYILVTLDFPRRTTLLDNLKQQNNNLGQQFHINCFPTLIVVNPDGKELGRMTGYNPGSGPDAVIATLKSFPKS